MMLLPDKLPRREKPCPKVVFFPLIFVYFSSVITVWKYAWNRGSRGLPKRLCDESHISFASGMKKVQITPSKHRITGENPLPS
jgi:hypothetical protein